MEVDAAIEKEVPLWKISRFVWASFFWSQFFPSIFSFPWYIKDFLIAHTIFFSNKLWIPYQSHNLCSRTINCPHSRLLNRRSSGKTAHPAHFPKLKVPWSLGRGGWGLSVWTSWFFYADELRNQSNRAKRTIHLCYVYQQVLFTWKLPGRKKKTRETHFIRK